MAHPSNSRAYDGRFHKEAINAMQNTYGHTDNNNNNNVFTLKSNSSTCAFEILYTEINNDSGCRSTFSYQSDFLSITPELIILSHCHFCGKDRAGGCELVVTHRDRRRHNNRGFLLLCRTLSSSPLSVFYSTLILTCGSFS